MFRKMKSTAFMALALTALISLVFVSFALADSIPNNLDNSVDAVAEVMSLNAGGAFGITQLSVLPENEDGKNGCNLTGQTTLVVSVNSSNPTVATVSPSSITFTSCGFIQILTVSPVADGSTTISISQTSNNTGGTFNLAPATFIVNVTAPQPANTAPTISISGITLGSNYEVGSVPAATCELSDAEDGDSSFAATLSDITGSLSAYGLGEQTASCSYTDAGGLTASASVTYGIVDTTAPVITFVSRTAANANGWNNGDVTVTWSCTDDNGSGVADPTVSQTISTEGTHQPATGTCEDHAGNTVSDTQTGINIDKTSPTITATLNPPSPALPGWYNLSTGAPTVSFTCSDNLSDVVSTCPAPYSFPEGSSQGYSKTIYDLAGNSAAASVSGINVDLTAPVITDLGPTTAPNGTNDWYISAVTNKFHASDTLSGFTGNLNSYDFTKSSGTADGNSVYVSSGTVTDLAGNITTAIDSNPFKIDLTDPSITFASRSHDTTWTNTSIVVTWTCTDGGSDVVDASVSQTVSAEGAEQTATGVCTDLAGRSSSKTETGINIDKTAPVITDKHLPSGTQGTNGWYVSAVTNQFEASDNLSGFASNTNPYQFTKSSGTAEGSDITVSSGTVTDLAGNTSAAIDSAAFKIDLTAPTNIALVGGPDADASYVWGTTPVAPTCTAVETVSTPVICVVTGYSISVGQHTMTATATNNAGLTTTATRSYTLVAWTLFGFYQPVDMPTLANPVILNTVKNGSTVPLKFEIFAGTTELTDIASVKSLMYAQINCDASAPTDDIETVATGGTSLRYDATSGQFVYNWKTPSTVGKCYRVTMTTQDLSTLVAYFKLK